FGALFSGESLTCVEQIDAAMRPFEGGYLSAEQLGSAAGRAAAGGRIVIWTTPTLEDRLFLWFACRALLMEGVSVEQIAIAEPRVLLPDENPELARYAPLQDIGEEA